MSDTAQLHRQTQVIERIAECVRRARVAYPETIIQNPEVRFDLRGRKAGMACYFEGCKGGLIRINPDILRDFFQHMIDITAPHEVAHLVMNDINPGVGTASHGREWRRVMRLLGVKHPKARSTLPLPYAIRTVKYKCPCREYELTIRRHRNFLNGRKYYCRYSCCWLTEYPGSFSVLRKRAANACRVRYLSLFSMH